MPNTTQGTDLTEAKAGTPVAEHKGRYDFMFQVVVAYCNGSTQQQTRPFGGFTPTGSAHASSDASTAWLTQRSCGSCAEGCGRVAGVARRNRVHQLAPPIALESPPRTSANTF